MDEESLRRVRHDALAAQAAMIVESWDGLRGTTSGAAAESPEDAEAFFEANVDKATFVRFRKALDQLIEHPESMLAPHHREALDRIADTVFATVLSKRGGQ